MSWGEIYETFQNFKHESVAVKVTAKVGWKWKKNGIMYLLLTYLSVAVTENVGKAKKIMKV